MKDFWNSASIYCKGVTIPGSGGMQVKASLYMDDVAVFCADLTSVRRLLKVCEQFERASGAKVNRGKSEAMFFGNWADRSFVPFTVREDYLKVLGIWFGAKIGMSTLPRPGKKCRSNLVGKNLVIRYEVLSVLLYVAQVWAIPRSCAAAVTMAIFKFIWRSKMDLVRRETMHKSPDKGGKDVPNPVLCAAASSCV